MGGHVTVGYIRVTGREPGPDERLRAQRAAIDAHCLDHGLTLAKVYQDDAIAGTDRSARAALFHLLDEIPLLGTQQLVVAQLDRLIHQGEIGRQILKELRDQGVAVYSVAEDPETVTAKTSRVVSTTPAALKSATTKIRALKRGKAPAGRAPFGFRRVPVPGETTSRLSLVEDEAETVRWIFREYLRRKSMAKVARGLAERGIAAPVGKQWSRASVAWILGNEIYIGMVKYGAMRCKGEHQAIIAPVVFHKVQKLREANRRTLRASTTRRERSPDTDELLKRTQEGADATGPGALTGAEERAPARAATSGTAAESPAEPAAHPPAEPAAHPPASEVETAIRPAPGTSAARDPFSRIAARQRQTRAGSQRAQSARTSGSDGGTTRIVPRPDKAD